MKTNLATIPVSSLKGIGAALETKLAKIGINSVQDLLFHLPLRYQDRTRITPIGALRHGDEVIIEAEIKLTDISKGRRRSLVCRVQDGTGSLTLRFFYFSAQQQKGLSQGTKIRCFGEVRHGAGSLEMIHPEYKRLDSSQPTPVETHLTPIYPTTEGLRQDRIRALTTQALKQLEAGYLEELLPPELLNKLSFPELKEAITYIHQPPVDANLQLLKEGIHPAQRRLAIEELLAHHLSLIQLRNKTRSKGAPKLTADQGLKQQLLAQLPFSLTQAQHRVSMEITQDLKCPYPMLRLVQGDVGSGKTLVAALAVIQAIESGYQAVIMAPTEILAEQHYNNFSNWLTPLGIKTGWLIGRLKGKARAEQLQEIITGKAQVIIGTHALFQQDVTFANIGLIVIDEQHRFGVHQRLSLREKGRKHQQIPHQLIMTATPIPRTLTMSAYADLDCSIIDELPPGRTPVNTVVIADTKREQVIQRVEHACSENRQIYWVCTLIEESDVLQCQAAEVTAEELRQRLPKINIGLVHGRMKSSEKAEIMQQFQTGKLNLLVATTVIEVGVDVPNASVMIIENPERLGLAQLHQLRGRVGRGQIESHCILMYHPPLSGQGQERLAVMRATTDGFKIAEKDLQLRGPGEVLGTRQTGGMQFKTADLQRDADLLPQIKLIAEQIKTETTTTQQLIERWLGQDKEYGSV